MISSTSSSGFHNGTVLSTVMWLLHRKRFWGNVRGKKMCYRKYYRQHGHKDPKPHTATHRFLFNRIPHSIFNLGMPWMNSVHKHTQLQPCAPSNYGLSPLGCQTINLKLVLHGWYEHISNTYFVVQNERNFIALRKWIATTYYPADLCSPLNYVLSPCNLQAAMELLIPIQPTVQPGSSWRDEQVNGAMRPARTSRKFSIRDQPVLLTWHSLQPLQ